ncbi:DUF1311 domain-containing protein [Ralstonia sp. TCR112]|uniref:lysozyme inhibitor LprI family protein n=1 Tax=Ralstonia sp. TCR112 TaxID=2601730 RepID=UPI0011BF902A|nr:lysozyme inhibitor LprI family protein [Ralstonia sp. TCR112]TXD63278.1 DUF1311 domain-containing protein [Ralstonia sp. TCR112]
MKKHAFVAFAIAVISLSAFSDELENCVQQAMKGHPNDDMYCYAQESLRLESQEEKLFSDKLRQLNNLPSSLEISSELKRKARHDFLEAQKHWKTYVEAACRFSSDSNLGSGRARAYSQCKIDLIKRRISDLEVSGF